MRLRRLLVNRKAAPLSGSSLEVCAGEFGEAVEALAHVAGLEGDVDFEVAVEGEHSGLRRGL